MDKKSINNLIKEINMKKMTIPKGKILVSGNIELIDTLKTQGWKGEFYHSKILRVDECYIFNKMNLK